MLPENIVFSNGHSAPDVDVKIQILGGPANDGAVQEMVVIPHPDTGVDFDTGLNYAVFPDLDAILKDRIGTNTGMLADMNVFADNGGCMDFGHWLIRYR